MGRNSVDWHRALAVHGLAERVDHAAHHGLADRHLGDAVRPLDDVAFLDEGVVAEEHGADVVLLEVQHHADDVAGKREQLARHRPVEAVDAGDAVAHLDHAADLLEVDLGLVARELALDDLADLACLDHVRIPLSSRWRIRSSCALEAVRPPRSCRSRR